MTGLIDKQKTIESLEREYIMQVGGGWNGNGLRLAHIERAVNNVPVYDLPEEMIKELAEQYQKYMALDFVKDPETKALYATYRIFAERGRRRDGSEPGN